MRTLVVRFFAAEDGAPIEGTASLLAGRWRTTVDAKLKSIGRGSELRFEIADSTVVNEVVVTAHRRLKQFLSWPKSDVLNVKLEKAGELILAANHDALRSVKVHAIGQQEGTAFLHSLGHDFQIVLCGQSINFSLSPGAYRIDVIDDMKNAVTQLAVDLRAWRTIFVEIP